MLVGRRLPLADFEFIEFYENTFAALLYRRHPVGGTAAKSDEIARPQISPIRGRESGEANESLDFSQPRYAHHLIDELFVTCWNFGVRDCPEIAVLFVCRRPGQEFPLRV
ncbi:hypothetical protein V525_17285 [Gordonia alkanivorans CGMCC 6845]|uniref:Uncharacterized protein n=1 Tax=Gordonia alkanivorans CGMCC 6845 TaxID=1423140 RepID=W9D8K1_9ACTN|nr:hypothetical protein V525_17285 [Gordonia alkanivorans CGMCC 6845]